MKKEAVILLHFAKLCYNHFMEILMCPICGKPLRCENKSYFCLDRHCYDIARNGYVNLLPPNRKRTPLPGDNAEMIAARVSLMDNGYYSALAECLLDILGKKPFGTVLDIGCGEGYLTRIINEQYPKMLVVGIDISKFAVDAASKRCKENVYCVASSASLPIQDHTVDAVINTFAPIDLTELKRVLAPKGILIKIVPAPSHLWHLKELLYDNPYKNPDNSFEPEGFRLLEKSTVKQDFTVAGNRVFELLQMTPYYYKTSKDSIERLTSMPEVTTELEFSVLVFELES